jgi:DNA-binding NarL/FixJ family response regulator
MSRPRVSIVGRERELAAVRAFAAADGTAGPLVLEGAAGMGKTTLWEAGVAAARERGRRVLRARPGDGEAPFAFSALVDLFDGIDLAELGDLPAPQRRALDIVLLRVEPDGAAADPHAIRVGVLGALRALAAADPILVAVDDVQWLDAPSSGALAFAARRLAGEQLRFLLARRTGSPSELERALHGLDLERLVVEPLSPGDIRRMLAERLGLSVRRDLLRRITQTTLGNPLFALELGRELAARGSPRIGDEITIPPTVEDALGTRVARLPRGVAGVLLAVALGTDLRTSQLAAMASGAELDAALDAGVVAVDGDHVRATHPLLAAAARQRSHPHERRAMHRELAGVVRDDQQRVRHLALAAEVADADLAAEVAAAAARAAMRGATHDAVELAEHALRLTPPASDLRSERLLALASYLETAGERDRVMALLKPEMSSLPRGGPRVRALLLLSESSAVGTYADHESYFWNALVESGREAELRARVLATKALNVVAEGVEQIREAETWALESLAAARAAGPELERLALRALGWARSLRGRPIDDLCERFRAVSDAASPIADSPEPVAALQLLWRGDLSRAGALLTPFLDLADERGEAISYAWLRLNMCELELRAADWDAVSRRLDEWAESDEGALLIAPTYQRCRALVAAGRGRADEVERWARPALAEAEARGYRWQVLESQRALGIGALLARDPGRAVGLLGAVWRHTVREAVDEPGAFPVAPDLVEALVELGELDQARAVADRLRRLAHEQQHPWGLASAKRCAAVIRLASARDDDHGPSELAQAADEYASLGLGFERARTLLSLGRAQRRSRRWGAARRSLQATAAAFEEIASEGWAEQARSEIGRVGARRPHASGELTPAEQRVVELAAGGLSNKEIAQRLVVTVNTVEVHLSRAYAKLNVRSRSQLADRLSRRDADPA